MPTPEQIQTRQWAEQALRKGRAREALALYRKLLEYDKTEGRHYEAWLDGTAAKAALTNYTVAGKTGTAQKVENGVYVSGKYISSFIGFFPADDPELCIAIFLDEPKQGYYGGLTAAPVFKQVAERAANYLNIRPDLKDSEPSVEDTAAAANELRLLKSVAEHPLNQP